MEFKQRGLISLFYCATVLVLMGTSIGSASAAQMIGYWESWESLPLANVSANYNVVDLAFAVPTGPDGAKIHMDTSTESDARITADVKTLHKRGVKVLLSIGGSDTPANLQLLNAVDITNFENAVEKLVHTYECDGIDLDLENQTLMIAASDNDYMHPKSPAIVNLIQACHDLVSHFGPAFMITMAPETVDVDAYGQYGGEYGSYLPLIYGIRDILTFVAVQCYNSGSQYGRDGGIYDEGSPDFQVAMSDLLLGGYKMANGQKFGPLAPGQVVCGVLATGSASDGYLDPQSVLHAAKYLGTGARFSGGVYRLSSASGYSNFGGIMAWDIDDDQSNGLALSHTLGNFLHGIGPK